MPDISVDESEAIPRILEELVGGLYEAVLAAPAPGTGGGGGGSAGGKPTAAEVMRVGAAWPLLPGFPESHWPSVFCGQASGPALYTGGA